MSLSFIVYINALLNEIITYTTYHNTHISYSIVYIVI